ncbi:MAG: T9SS type A sorting domain-containing protein, partial [Bacteroidetes bacterium]|nr:T9SS type A sorting domain-containing protein [Bacteroidota bacterium]
IGNENYQTGVLTHIKKLDSDGKVLWDKYTGKGWSPESMAVDNENNLLISGTLWDYAELDNFIFQKTGPVRNILLIKMDENGKTHWAKEEGMINWNIGNEIKVDKKNNIYLVGTASGESVFNGVPLEVKDNAHVFLAKYRPDGEFQWIREGGIHSRGYSLAIDSNGDCYIAGTIRGTTTFSDGKNSFTLYPPKVETRNGNTFYDNNIFLGKYTASGELKWVIQTEGNEFGHNYPMSICIDSKDRVYLTGMLMSGYGGTTNITTFGNFSLSSSYYKVYIARLIDDGTLNIVKPEEGRGLNIFPNPARNQLNIEYIQNKPVNNIYLRVLNLNGSLIYNEIISGFDGKFFKAIDLSNYSSGIYFVEILAGKERTVQKVVVD